MKIVVVGGTGLIGSKVVGLARAEGHTASVAVPNTGVNTVTGEGLFEALMGVDIVIDVSNSPSFEAEAVMAFFKNSTSNLLDTGKATGVKHHVALSIVGTNRLPDNAYFQAKLAQEAMIRNHALPYTIVHATQFLEFLPTLADMYTTGNEARVPTGNVQLIAADDVASMLLEAALSRPQNGDIEIAGPERAPMNVMVERYFAATGDNRQALADPTASYFGALLEENSLVPHGEARRGTITFDQWIGMRAAA